MCLLDHRKIVPASVLVSNLDVNKCNFYSYIYLLTRIHINICVHLLEFPAIILIYILYIIYLFLV